MIQTKALSKKVEFWALFGPFVVLFALLLVLFKASPEFFILPIGALCAFPMCVKWKTKGFIFSSIALLIGGALYYIPLPANEAIWMLAFAVLVVASLAVMTFSSKEVASLLGTWQKLSLLNQEEQKRLQEKLIQLHNEWALERKNLCEDIFQKNEEITKLREALRIRLQVKEEEVLPKDVKEVQDLYKQLRIQFDQKGEVLHQARAEIFKLEGELESLKKAKDQEEKEELMHLQSLLNYTFEEKTLLEKEVENLHEIISTLSA